MATVNDHSRWQQHTTTVHRHHQNSPRFIYDLHLRPPPYPDPLRREFALALVPSRPGQTWRISIWLHRARRLEVSISDLVYPVMHQRDRRQDLPDRIIFNIVLSAEILDVHLMYHVVE